MDPNRKSTALTRRIPRRRIAVALIAGIGLFLIACQSEPAVDIAPVIELELVASPVPTASVLEALPTVPVDPLPTLDAPPTLPPPTPAPPTPTSGSQDFGAVISRDYVQPPTSTPRPTDRPTPTNPPPTRPASAYTTAVPINQARLDGAQMGIQAHFNHDTYGWSRVLHQIAPLRVDWIKLQASWRWLQPDRPGQFDQNFKLFQLHVQEADKRGFKVLLSIAKAPDWSRNYNRGEDGPPDDLNELHWFIHKLVETVGPNIDAIEIWNEPNLKREWTGGRPISGASYMEMFRVGYDAVREFAPQLAVVTAALAPTGNSDGLSVNDREFLQQMYQAGLAGYSDVKIGVHPYGWGNPPDFMCCDNVPGQGWDDRPQFFFLQTIRDYRGIIAANNHNAPMWVTEFGWATWEDFPHAAPEVWMAYNSAIDQSNYALRAFQIGQSRPDIELMILWNLNFAYEAAIHRRDELAAYGLLYPAFNGSDIPRERPLYQALASRP